MAETKEGAQRGVDVATIARVLMISPRRVQQLVKDDGMPQLERGRYSLVECVQFYIKYWQQRADGTPQAKAAKPVDDIRASKRQLIDAQARIKEFELAKMTGDVVSVGDVDDLLRRALDGVKKKLLTAPRVVAPKLLRLETLLDAQIVVEEFVHALLKDLSATADDLDLGEAQAEAEEQASATAAPAAPGGSGSRAGSPDPDEVLAEEEE